MECAFLIKTSFILFFKIQTMIQVLGGLDLGPAQNLACDILVNSEKSNVDAKLVASIISVESNFISSKISRTRDISIAQINTRVWKSEYPRLFGEPLDVYALKSSNNYAIKVMTDILSNLKERFKHKDELWFARYHSRTVKYKVLYASKVKRRIKFLENIKVKNEENNILAQIDR